MNAATTPSRSGPSRSRLGRFALLAVILVLGVLIGRFLLPPTSEAADGSPSLTHAAHEGAHGNDASARDAVAPPAAAWTCSMHPQIRMDRPGDCPICGMPLVPASASSSGDGSVTLTERSQRITSIEVQAISRRPLEHELRTVGRIEFAEPLVAYITARTAARIERVYADFTGMTVAAGDHLVDLYSPELVVAQQELLSARAAGGQGVAREKLELLGVNDAQLDAVIAEGKPRTVLTVHAPVGGTVIEKNVREQTYVNVGDPLYTIANLSTVWMFADIYEFELPWVAIGQHVEVHIEGAPGASFAGTVAFIEPVVREATRTVRMRVNLPNPDGRLKPGMFASATIRATLDASGQATPSPLAGKWVCPMHPDITAEGPGACPLCGMDLQKVPDAGHAASGASAAHAAHSADAAHDAGAGAPDPDALAGAGRWVCPMNDQPPADAPGRCAVCGMKLVPEAPHAAHDAVASGGDALLLAVPATAVLDTGLRQIVWVEREPGRYAAAEVRLGARAGDFYPVLEGLTEGDRVVVHGNFLLDSQAQIEGQPSLLFPRGLDLTRHGKELAMIARWLISFSLRNPLLVCLLAVGTGLWGAWALRAVPVDAIPDIGEKQVIVFADWAGRSPQDVEDQITYPLTAALQGTPRVKTIRGMSGFGFSMVFVIFEDSADYYWARTRVLERLSSAQQRLPEGVTPVLGPDATALGQVFWYTLEGEGFSLEELRAAQDWYVRLQLQAVPGVSEVASIGGHVREYQIDVDPDRLRAHRVALPAVFEAVRRSNLDVGAQVVEKNGLEFLVRGVGFVKSVADLEDIVIRQEGGTPLYVRNVARVTLGPEFRRGVLNKAGVEAVGGIVLCRFGANPREVVDDVKARIAKLLPGLPSKVLPDGRVSRMELVSYYDRSVIIDETMATLSEAITQELLFAGAVVLLFLLHLRASLSILATLPLSVAIAYIAMERLGVDANIMSIAGLAIAIGDVADMGIIMTENIYRHLAQRRAETVTREGWLRVVEEAAHEVGPAILTAVSNTVISFVPVFFLQDQEGKLFQPLAYAKTFAIAGSVLLALTVVPALALVTLREITVTRKVRVRTAGLAGLAALFVTRLLAGWLDLASGAIGWPTSIAAGIIIAAAVWRITGEKLVPMEANRVSRFIHRTYEPSLRWVLAHKRSFLVLPALLVLFGFVIWLGFATIMAPVRAGLAAVGLDPGLTRPWAAASHAFPGLGREFMPPLDEGSFLSMPSLLPAASLNQVMEVLAVQNARLAELPEVQDVVGKAGRSESALDPAPIGMIETIVTLKPQAEWRRVHDKRFWSDWPAWLQPPFRAVWSDSRAISKPELLAEMQAATAMPGVLPTWLQPIQTRLVMLSSGFRAMMGVKVFGPDQAEIERVGLEMERVLRDVPGAVDVVADRIVGKPYLEFLIDREAAARYGVTIEDVNDVIEIAVGGERTTTTVEGTARFPVRVRYARELRDTLEALQRVLLPGASGAQVPLSAVATLRYEVGPQEIKSENTAKVGYVTLNTRDRDEISVVEDADRALLAAIADGRLSLPPGYFYVWGGQFEAQVRATERLAILVPTVLAVMLLMLYLGLGAWWLAVIVFIGIAVSMTGGFLALWVAGINLSVAVWVGMIALMGVADDDAVVMLTYQEQVFGEARKQGRLPASVEQVRDLVVEAGLRRIRPCLMTTATTVIGLLPVFLVDGRGSDVMRPMAIPSIGGMAVQLITLFIAPCLYCAVMERRLRRAVRDGGGS